MDVLHGLTAYMCYFLLYITDPVAGKADQNQFPPKQNGVEIFHQYENIVPEIFHEKKRIEGTYEKGKHLDSITVLFTAFNRSFILDLALNKELFSTSYVEKRYHSTGSSIHTPHPLTQRQKHCYYHGTVRYSPDSLVALSTCDGIRGFISTNKENYHIDTGHGYHRLFRDSDRRRRRDLKCGTDGHNAHFHPSGTNKNVHSRIKRDIHGPYDSNQNTRYVELYLVNDYRTYERNGGNTTSVIRRSQDITNIVSRLYRPLNIYVALVGVEVWEGGDQITVTTSADATMENFLRYRRERINPYHRNDNAQLVTGIFFDHGVVGKAIKGPICTYQFSGGVNMDYDGLVTLVATTVAHEMGHNFGMEHDNDSTCYCPKDKCIMAATSGQTSPTDWSTCSKNALQEAFELGMDYCLRNKPSQIFEGPVCGNGFVEDGEECDCGLPQDCHNRCCNASSCKMYHQAKCATGRCCDLSTCKPKEKSTLCREPIGECDLPEFCDGSAEYCPTDVFLQNGLSCKNGQSYCYKGKCNTHSDQCKLLWGDTGRASDPICFQQLNMRGDQDGNCGYNWTKDTYSTCRREDVMCGLLHCVHLNEKLMFWRDNLAHTMRASFLTRGNTQYVCRSAMLDVGLDMPDPGMVPDGAKCEVNKICVNHKCVPLAKMNIPQCPGNGCNGQGVCNSNGNCHCNNGFDPPYCNRPGFGGSVDSGPSSNEYANKSLLVGLLVFFLVILPLVGVFIFFGYFYRSKLKTWWHLGPKLKYGVPGKKPKPPPQPVRTTSNINDQRPKSVHMKRAPTQVEISDPVLTGSTNRESHAFVGPARPISMSPKRERIPMKPDPVVPASAKVQPKPDRVSQKSGAKIKPDRPSTKPERSVPRNERLGPPEGGARIVKRESFRGSEISSPVLMSTTNRNSDVFPEDEFHEIPGQSQLIPRSSGSRSPPPIPGHGTTPRAKRTQSDREKIERPLSIPPSKGALARQAAVSTSMKTQRPPAPPPRPVPPDPKESDSEGPVYQNDISIKSKGPKPVVKKDVPERKDPLPKKHISYNWDSSQKHDLSQRKEPPKKKDQGYRDRNSRDHRTQNSLSDRNKNNDSARSNMNSGLKSKPMYTNLASPEGDLDAKEHSSVSALRAKFGASDSRTGSVGRSNSRISDRPSIASKPSPKVVRSFNV
ncbi:disintegrin and metalloproteinase domain-containing protein 9-like isoform X1 [Haliotis rubra]|uniref:disintegrin and metalloproteinase domain-containing protein 9-like isoform X1 n=1 Tax=Haliotis rubra TaxID=36100 RepID=UPI001EE56075|nr:disintegrin and metalloproteinase domain-containing protein 9-like isoform X1 [Haliotis rubra]